MTCRSISPGIAIGKAHIYKPFIPGDWKDRNIDAQAELDRFFEARQIASAELDKLITALGETAESKIFKAHTDLLQDSAIEDRVSELITDQACSVEGAVDTAYNEFAEILKAVDDPLLCERAADLNDVRIRMLRVLAGEKERNLSQLTENVIVFTRELMPSDTARMQKDRVLGLVTEQGGETSHSAIIAKTARIPALSEAPPAETIVADGEMVIVDAISGRLIISPDEQQLLDFTQRRDAWLQGLAESALYLDSKPVMRDGTYINICLNIHSDGDEELEYAPYSDGAGLLRSEYFYMQGSELPDEEKQYTSYRRILEAFGEREVILRTLDIGGDKQVDCLQIPKEDNPFLGLRALRLCLSRPELFLTQLRAAYRASVHGNLSIMFPMVSGMEDIQRAKEQAAIAREQLRAQGIAYREVKLGIMIELPSIALMADEAAKEVDFASFGTNDLCQYLTAVDRLSPTVQAYYQKYNPALFRLMNQAADAFLRRGKPVGVCGELGGDIAAAPLLIGMGIEKLSMNMSALAQMKRHVQGLDMTFCREIRDRVLASPDEQSVIDILQEGVQCIQELQG